MLSTPNMMTHMLAHGISIPLLAGIEAMVVRTHQGHEIVLPSCFQDNSILPDPDEWCRQTEKVETESKEHKKTV